MTWVLNDVSLLFTMANTLIIQHFENVCNIKFREREGYSIVQQEMIIIFDWIFFIGSGTFFLHIQIRLHHPCGVVNEANGVWVCNNIQWRKCIDIMNSFTINELDQDQQGIALLSEVLYLIYMYFLQNL